jgi:hypothetical protein
MLASTRGAVGLLVVLYSINVFITFTLSQLGMVVHWWRARRTESRWRRKLAINGFGLALTTFILVSLCIVKFHEGGWGTLFVTGLLVAAAFAIKRHYTRVTTQLRRLDELLVVERVAPNALGPKSTLAPNQRVEGNALHLNRDARTAILLVNGYNGLGLHTALQVPRMFGDTFRNFVFLSVGAVDAGNFKGAAEIESLRTHTAAEAERFGAAIFTSVGHDTTGELMQLAATARAQFPNSVFFAGQLLFARETRLTRLLHNFTAFSLQRHFFAANLPFVVLPIRVGEGA